MNLPAIPKRGTAITADVVAAIEAAAIERLPTVNDINLLLEWGNQAAALEIYLRGKELQGPILGARRRVEARIGQLLGEAKLGSHHSVTTEGAKLDKDDRADFRILAKAFLISLDLEQWRTSRRALVAFIRQKLGLNPDGQEREHESCVAADLAVLCDAGKEFGTIYADPPWAYGNQGTRAATENHYDGSSIEDICALPVARMAAERSHLHLWTTNGFLFEAKQVIEAWGFEYRSCFVWVKPSIGIGNYWRVSHEFLLLGVRGGLTFEDKSLRSWGEFPRGAHSEKPEQIRRMIERASPGPRLELYGRRAVDGWTVWGDQIERNLFHQAAVA